MNDGIRFSLRLNNDLSVADFAALAERAEENGFDQVWVSHDLFWRSAPVLVAAAAARTDRLLLGIGVVNPYSAHPSEIAMTSATLQELTGGRFLLGIGAGARDFLAWGGIARPEPLAAVRSAVSACRSLLSGTSPSEREESWAPEAFLRFPAEQVPIYLAAMGPKMTALAGEVADGVLALSFPPERATPSRRAVEAAATAVGRDPEVIDIPACFWCSLDENPERADAALAEKLAYYGASISPVLLAESGLSPDDFRPAEEALRAGDAAAAGTAITSEMLGLGISGGSETVLRRCRDLLEEGARHLSFGPPLGPSPLHAVELLGRDVLSPLRSERALHSGEGGR